MKLINYTLLDIDDYLQQENTNRVISLFGRVHLALRLMTDQLALLETMSPKEYQEIRLAARQWQRPGIARLPRDPTDAPAHLGILQDPLPGEHGLTIEGIYNSDIQPRRRLHGGGSIRRI